MALLICSWKKSRNLKRLVIRDLCVKIQVKLRLPENKVAYCILPLTESQVLNAHVSMLVLVAKMCNWTGKDRDVLRTNHSSNLLCTCLRSSVMVCIKARRWLAL